MQQAYQSYKVPISVKGIIFEGDKVWLRKNERNEWELPGGKMDEGEQPEHTVIREVQEELGFNTNVIDIIQAYLYTIKVSQDENRGVLVVSYLCKIIDRAGDFELIGEAGEAKFEKFKITQLEDIVIPEFYKLAILKAYNLSKNL